MPMNKKNKKKFHLRAVKTNIKLDTPGVDKGNKALDEIEKDIEK